MTPERWAKVKEIFQLALSRTPSDRTAFLASVCGEDESLRKEVVSLLASHEKDGSFIDSPAYQAVANVFVDRSELTAGQQVGHYQIISTLGKGGMGEVYLAQDTKLHRRVAIKVLSSDSIAKGEGNQRLLREAQAAAQLDHPNICAVHEIAEEDGRAFIIMTYVEGETLDVRLKRSSLELSESLQIAVQVADAIAEAHAHGIIHRDIKPANVIITPRGQAKVMDFGLAKLSPIVAGVDSALEDPTAARLTQPGAIIGTVPYMSPEQVHGQRLDARTDIFSFGVMLYQMLSGQQPFAAESPAGTISAILTKEPPPLAQCSEKLELVVSKCLQKDPEKRYQTMGEVASDLEEVRNADVTTAKIKAPVALEADAAALERATNDDIINNAAITGFPPAAGTSPVTQSVRLKPPRAGLLALSVVALTAVALVVYLFLSRANKPAIDSIAVLPFQNASGDPNTEYLSDGISEALINSLTELHQLRVIARTTTFRYRGQDVDPQQVGRDLSVHSVLTGSVRQAGENLAIQVDLVDATTGTELWGQQYEHKASDLLSIKQAIAREVSDTLRLRLSGDEQRQLTKRDATSGESFQSYLKGRYYWNKRTPDALKKALEEFQEAIDRDPSFALGYVGLADTYLSQEHYSGLGSREMLPKAREAVDRALAIDNSLAEAHTTSASICQHEWRWAETEAELKRAISLNPNYPTAHHFYGYYLYIKRQFDDAAREIRRAHELDPLSPVISENVSMVQLLRGDLDGAIQQGEKTISLEPKFADAHYVLAFAYLKRGRTQDATAEFQKAVELSNRAATYLGDLGYCYALTGRRADALAIAKELEEKFSHNESSGLFVAGVYAGLGDKDKAFAWLNKDIQQRSGGLPTVTWRPLFESLRSDPRYTELVKAMGL